MFLMIQLTLATMDEKQWVKADILKGKTYMVVIEGGGGWFEIFFLVCLIY